MSYSLEHRDEYERLEFQATLPQYDFSAELQELNLKPGARVIDAGSGSGLVSRYLASKYPEAHITGYDASELRIHQSRRASSSVPQIRFEVADLSHIPASTDSADFILCRYVLEHLGTAERAAALKEMHRCLKPGGELLAIDVDGWFQNIFPTTPLIEDVATRFNQGDLIDLRIGRKIPRLLAEAGFKVTKTRIELMNFTGEHLEKELKLIDSRISQGRELFADFLGSTKLLERFHRDVHLCLESPNAVLFYAKFLVYGQKES